MNSFSMAIRNMKKSVSDYVVYFLTLIAGVAIFYVFNSVGDQAIVKEISGAEYEIIELLLLVLEMLSIGVAFVLGFLIIYANHFLIRRRKKEFGVYMLLGMGKKDISKILVNSSSDANVTSFEQYFVITGNTERIGDHAADISEMVTMLAQEPYIQNLESIRKMASETVYMLIQSIEAYVEKNMEKAKHVIAHDDIVDDLFASTKKELIELIHQDKNNGEQATDLLMVAKYFERIGDHATNIAEHIVFAFDRSR